MTSASKTPEPVQLESIILFHLICTVLTFYQQSQVSVRVLLTFNELRNLSQKQIGGMMKKIFVFALLSLCILSLGTVPAFAASKDRLVIGLVQGTKILDPQATTIGVALGLIGHIHETLVTIKDGKITPMLAESWKILDDKATYVFTIKQGVKFHNGETMTVDDVVYSFKRAKSPAGVASRAMSMYLKDVEKIDDRTIKLITEQPLGEAFLGSLTHPWSSILSRKAVEKFGADYGQNPVGTGKFKLKDWSASGDLVEMERFDEYHGVKAKLKTLIFRSIIEAASRTIELESGAVDTVADLAHVDISRIRNNPKLEVVMVPSVRHYYLAFEVNLKPFDNVKVREAFSLAMNRRGMVKAAFWGHAEVARGVLPSTIMHNNYNNAEDFAYDPAKGKKLLAEAGVPQGFKTEIIISDRNDYMSIGTILQNNLKEIGVEVELKVYEPGAYFNIQRKPLHPPVINNWSANVASPDPFFATTPLLHSTLAGLTNRAFYKNPEVDSLLEKGAETMDPAQRTLIYKELWDKLNHDLPYVWLLTPINISGKVKNLKGIDFSHNVGSYYSDAYFE